MPDRKKKVLVTDDEPGIVQIIRSTLSYDGFDVATASDGVACLETVNLENPDLIILDVMMPRKDGWQVLSELKANPETEDIPVIMLTAVDGLQDMNRGVELGIECYLTKPFEAAELLQLVRHILGVEPRA